MLKVKQCAVVIACRIVVEAKDPVVIVHLGGGKGHGCIKKQEGV